MNNDSISNRKSKSVQECTEQAKHHDHKHDHKHHEHQCMLNSSSTLESVDLTPSERVENGIRTSMRIMQMDCPTEERLIHNKLGRMAEVKHIEFNLMQRILTVVHSPDALDSIINAIRSLGFEPELPDASGHLTKTVEKKRPMWPLLLAVLAAASSEASHWLGAGEWLAIILALSAIFLCGLTTYKKGWIALRNGDLNINALMSIAVTGAMIIGQWPEAAMVMVLFTIAELIEAKSLDRARHAITGLMKLAPDRASVKQKEGSWLQIDAKAVVIGDIVRVKPGERIALDGEIINGRSTVDQSPITGESLPIEKNTGDQVFAGTINQSGSFEYRVTATTTRSTLSRIIHAVEAAQGVRAPTQRFVDKFSKIYTPVIFIVALVIAILPPFLFAATWQESIYNALVMLVIACPCALVISTPVTIVSGLSAAARHGILIKGGVYLEQGRKLNWLALDKTGTITHGKPILTDFQLYDADNSDTVHKIAISLASRSDHPVSQAIYHTDENKIVTPFNVENFTAIPGRGIRCEIEGRTYHLGNHRMVEELGLCSDQLEAKINAFERSGKTVVLLVDDKSVLALFVVADTVKENSRQAISKLHQLGIKTMMLTGDNPHTAEAIAQQVGIDEAYGNLLPEDKLSHIDKLDTQGTVVGMVGDGINDAPALARADIGFAMGAIGTDTAIETADVALMDDDLRKIPTFIQLSQATHHILLQNITLALGIKFIFMILTLIGLGSMWMAVFADVGASLLVIGNGMRLLRYKR